MFIFFSPYRLRLQNTPSACLKRGNTSPIDSPGYGIKPSDGEAPVLETWGNMKHPFIAISSKSIPTLSRSTCCGSINGSNNTVWYLNDWCLIDLLLIHCNTWNHLTIFTNPSARAGYDTRSIFKRSLTGLNSEFSFSLTSCLTKAEEPSLPYYLPIAGGRIIGFIPFPRVLVLCEMQSVSSRI